MHGIAFPFAHQRLVVLYAQLGRIEEAQRHLGIFTATFTNPDADVRHLLAEAREALRGERRGG